MTRNIAGSNSSFIQYAPRCDRSCQDCGLSNFGQPQLFFGTLKTELGKFVSESRIRLFERLARYWIFFVELFPHANDLGTLSRKKKCRECIHACTSCKWLILLGKYDIILKAFSAFWLLAARWNWSTLQEQRNT